MLLLPFRELSKQGAIPLKKRGINAHHAPGDDGTDEGPGMRDGGPPY